jgi:hypothetical protein
MKLVLYKKCFSALQSRKRYTIFKEYIFPEDILQRPNNSFRAFAPNNQIQEAVKQSSFVGSGGNLML